MHVFSNNKQNNKYIINLSQLNSVQVTVKQFNYS